jgi:drug/metabolite transporter (DMT)-like permease
VNRILLSLSYAFCWGFGQTLTKIALSEISEATLLVAQLGSSVLFLALAYTVIYRQFPFSQSSLQRGYAGVFEPALAYMIGIFGLSLTTASNATLIGASEVVLTILFAAVFLGEKLTRTKLLLAVVSFSGILLLMLGGSGGSEQGSLTGNLLVLLGTVFAVLYVLVSKKQIAGANPLQLTAEQHLVGLFTTVLCFGGLSFFDSSQAFSFGGITPQFWLLAVVAGILQYALGFLLYLIALQNVPVSHAAFYVALIPVFGVASAIALLGEQPSLTQWLGAVLVVASSYFANRLKPQ